MSIVRKLSICIPAYNRPEWLRRALESILNCQPINSEKIQIVVSDDSTDSRCQTIVHQTSKKQKYSIEYSYNNPPLGMTQNWTHSIQLSSGEYVLVLHDDDFLRSNGINYIIETIERTNSQYSILLFGVDVVNSEEKVLKTQTFKKEVYLNAKEAMLFLLSSSAPIRFPAIVFKRGAFDKVGEFKAEYKGVADFEMWSRLLSEFGVLCIPYTISAYTVHDQALTMTTDIFTEEIIDLFFQVFITAKQKKLLSEDDLLFCQAKLFHQFILAGAFRMLRRRKFKEFHQIMQLLELPTIKDLKPPKKWLLLRLIFRIIDRGSIILS